MSKVALKFTHIHVYAKVMQAFNERHFFLILPIEGLFERIECHAELILRFQYWFNLHKWLIHPDANTNIFVWTV